MVGPIFFPILLPVGLYMMGLGPWVLLVWILYLPFFMDWVYPSRYKTEGSPWDKIRYFPLLKGVKEYLDMKFVYEADLDRPQYLFGVHPHGHAAIPANAFINGYVGFKDKWKHIKLRALGATVLFWTPV